MEKKLLRQWKKVFESDLKYISYELKEIVKGPSLICLEGKLGAGKTAFVKSFVEDSEVLSPSYSILSDTKTVLHGDFYRINDSSEIIHIELSLYLKNKMYFFAEWGLKYIRTIINEIPENFELYCLEIEVLESDNEVKPRNFHLYSLLDY